MISSRLLHGISVFLVVTAASGGCGSSPATQEGFGSSPLVTVLSTSGALQVAVFTNPQPPTNGNVAVRYVVTDTGTKEPVDGCRWILSRGCRRWDTGRPSYRP